MEIAEYKKMDSIESGHFWFIAKKKFLDIVLEKFIGEKKLKILDIGCGTGAIMDYLKNKGHEVFGVDMSDEALKYCQAKGLAVEIGKADRVDFPDGYFDVVLSLDVLEHLDNDQEAVNEARRLLKKGGFFIATVPAHQFLWSYHDVALHHKRRYGKNKFVSLFNENWEMKLISWIHTGIFLPVMVVRLIRNLSKKKEGSSDVGQVGNVVNKAMNFLYKVEIEIFKIFGRLPFGVSIMAVVEKK